MKQLIKPIKHILLLIILFLSTSVFSASVYHDANQIMPGQLASGNFSIDGSLGIGITNPLAKLHVVDNVGHRSAIFRGDILIESPDGSIQPDIIMAVEEGDTNYGQISFVNATAQPYMYIGRRVGIEQAAGILLRSTNEDPKTGYIRFQTGNGTGDMYLDRYGNLGVGTSTPLGKIESVSSSEDNLVLTGSGVNGKDAWLKFNAARDDSVGATTVGGIVADAKTSFEDQSIRITMNNGSNYYTKFIVKGDGNIGIGTESPSADLQIGDGSKDTKIYIKSEASGSGNSTLEMGTSTRTWQMNARGSPYSLEFDFMGTGGGFDEVQDVLVLNSKGSIGIGVNNPSSTNALDINGAVSITRNDSVDSFFGITNYNTSSDSDSIIQAKTTGATGGDAMVCTTALGEEDWCFGIDNSDNNKFKISPNYAALDTATALTISTDGKVGIGTQAPAYTLDVRSSTLNTDKYASYVELNSYTTVTRAQYDKGFYSRIKPNIATGVTDSGYKIALHGEALYSNTTALGTLDHLIGEWIQYGIYSGNPTITNAYGLKIDPYNRNGTITNSYALYIADSFDGGSVTKSYGIYQADTSQHNYFAGRVGIGRASPYYPLHIKDLANIEYGFGVTNLLNALGAGADLGNKGIYISSNNTYTNQTQIQFGSEGNGNALLILGQRNVAGGDKYAFLTSSYGSVTNPLYIQAIGDDIILQPTSSGYVGIKTTDPKAPLEVSSVIKSTPTDAPGTCNADLEGGMYYDATLNEPCFCNGSGWVPFDGTGTC